MLLPYIQTEPGRRVSHLQVYIGVKKAATVICIITKIFQSEQCAWNMRDETVLKKAIVLPREESVLYIGIFSSCVLKWFYFPLVLSLKRNKTKHTHTQSTGSMKKDRKNCQCAFPEPYRCAAAPAGWAQWEGLLNTANARPAWQRWGQRPPGSGRTQEWRRSSPSTINSAKTQNEGTKCKHPQKKGELRIKVSGATGGGYFTLMAEGTLQAGRFLWWSQSSLFAWLS